MLTRAQFRGLYKYHHLLDMETTGHSHQVALLMRDLSREMGFSKEDCMVSYVLGYVHDCGKYYIPAAILQKNGPLSESEYDLIKAHPVLGAQIVFDATGSRELAAVIAAHHERLDGSGYPYGLGDRGILPLSRMLSICDSFEAMTAKRLYRSPLTAEAAATELQRCADIQFDKALVALFVEKVLPRWADKQFSQPSRV